MHDPHARRCSILRCPRKLAPRFWRRFIFDADPKRADAADYVQQMYTEFERRFQAGTTQLQLLPIHAV